MIKAACSASKGLPLLALRAVNDILYLEVAMPFVRTLAVFLVLSSALLADELRTLGGKVIVGKVTKVSDKDITLKTDKEEVKTPLDQVLAIDFQAVKNLAGDKYSDVRLLDDTVLHCGKIAIKGKDVTLTLLSGADIKLPLQFLVSVVHQAQDPALKKKWADVSGNRIKRDRIVILKDGELNALEGTIGEVDAEGKTIVFKREGGDKPLTIQLDRLHGMIFYRLEAAQGNPLCRAIDQQGNVLTAVKIGFDGKAYTLTTSFGAKITLAADALAKLDFNMGKLTYLSDMEPAKVVEKSGAGLVTHYRKDVNLDGEPIILERQHAKGLSLHAYTQLEYNLAGKYKEFKAILGVDQRVGSESQAQVSITCDGEERFKGVITAKETRPLAFSVKDITTLRITVSSRNFLDLHDHVTLADARVSQ